MAIIPFYQKRISLGGNKKRHRILVLKHNLIKANYSLDEICQKIKASI